MIELYQPKMLHEAIKLAKNMIAESAFSRRHFNPEKFAKVLESPDVFFAFYRNAHGTVIGGFMGAVTYSFFGDDVIASDFALYIEPEHRGGMSAARLVKAFEDWAINLGAKEIYIGQSTGVEPERTVQFYERLGYEKVGYTTRKEV